MTMTIRECLKKDYGTEERTTDQPIVLNIGFEMDGRYDETQFDLDAGESTKELEELWLDFCKETGCRPDSVTYIEPQ